MREKIYAYTFGFNSWRAKKLEFKIARQNFHVSVFNEIKNVNFDKCSLYSLMFFSCVIDRRDVIDLLEHFFILLL